MTILSVSGSTRDLGVHLLKANWSAPHMTWIKRTAGASWATPGGDFALLPSDVAIVSAIAPGTIIRWDVTDDVRVAHAAGMNVEGWLIKDVDEGPDASRVIFRSEDAVGDAPKLVVQYCP